MTSVYFSVSTSENFRPGMAVGEVWQAFARSRFVKKSFTIPVGNNRPIRAVDLEPGDYWVQVKFSEGRILKELVTVPAAAKANLILASVAEDVRPQPSSARSSVKFSTPAELAYAERDELNATIAPLDIPAGPPALPAPAGRRKRGFDLVPSVALSYEPFPSPTRSPFIRMSRVMLDPSILIGARGASSLLTTDFRLSRLHGRFDDWSGRTGDLAGKDLPTTSEMRPEEYFNQFLQTEYRVPTDATTGGDRLFIDLSNVEFPIEKAKSLITDTHAAYRDFVLLEEENGQSLTLVSIPRNLREDPARVTVKDDDPSPNLSLKVAIEFNDPLSNSLLQFLRNGDVSSAMTMIDSSQSILYAKFDHPVAAAAAAYLLIHAAPDTLRTPWQEWIGNLGRYFEEIPDAQILHATLLLQRGDPARWENSAGPNFEEYFPINEADRSRLAASLILSAVEKGPPIFRMGLSLMASNLRILKHAELSAEQKQSLARVESLVTWLSMRVDPIEPFSIFRLER